MLGAPHRARVALRGAQGLTPDPAGSSDGPAGPSSMFQIRQPSTGSIDDEVGTVCMLPSSAHSAIVATDRPASVNGPFEQGTERSTIPR